MQGSSALSSAGPLQYCWVSKLSLILTRHHGEHKWDQPSGENSDKPVSPLFRERRVWWPAKLPQACLGENRDFWKPSSLRSQPRSEQQRCREGPKGEASQWLCLRSVQNYRVSAQRILPCARPVPRRPPPPTPSQVSSEQHLPLAWTCQDEGFFFFYSWRRGYACTKRPGDICNHNYGGQDRSGWQLINHLYIHQPPPHPTRPPHPRKLGIGYLTVLVEHFLSSEQINKSGLLYINPT